MLPPGEITNVRINGKKGEFTINPGVGCIILEAETAPCHETVFELNIKPLQCELACPASIAEGDTLNLRIKGAAIERIDDRCGIFSQTQLLSKSELRAQVQNDLLKPYLGFGKLGQMTFSRRSFFLFCRPDKGAPYWMPVDLMILPRYEVAVDGEVHRAKG